MTRDRIQLCAATLALLVGATLPLQLVLCTASLALFAGGADDDALRHVLLIRYRLQWFAQTGMLVAGIVAWSMHRLDERRYGYDMLCTTLACVGAGLLLCTHVPWLLTLAIDIDWRYGPLFDPALLYGPFACAR